jgi:hypothetical protein
VVHIISTVSENNLRIVWTPNKEYSIIEIPEEDKLEHGSIDMMIILSRLWRLYKTWFARTTGFIGSLFGYTQLQLSLSGLCTSDN